MYNRNIMENRDEYVDIYFLIKRGKNKIFCDVYELSYELPLPEPAHKYEVYDILYDACRKA